MSEYRTVQGDTWDLIAYRKLGSTDYTDQLISANLEHVGKLLFPAGVTLRLDAGAYKQGFHTGLRRTAADGV